MLNHGFAQAEVPLGTPDVLVCSVGTEIFFEATGADPSPDVTWTAQLDQGWDRPRIVELLRSLPGFQMQVASGNGLLVHMLQSEIMLFAKPSWKKRDQRWQS